MSNGFSGKDQTRLRDFAIELTKAGVNVMISNSDSEFIANLYQNDNFTLEKLFVPRVISCRADGRQSVYETLIVNY